MAELGQLAKVAYRIVALEAYLTEERADNAKLQEEIANTEESSMLSPSPRQPGFTLASSTLELRAPRCGRKWAWG